MNDPKDEEGRPIRRSRKHVLDLLSQSKDTVLAALNEILRIPDVVITAENKWRPTGYTNIREAVLDELDETWIPTKERDELAKWWLVHREHANTPNWDLLSTAAIRGQPGLVMVEAKAHENELKTEGKALKARPGKKISERSEQNHEKIASAINEANAALNKVRRGFAISRDTHYQHANRIAFGAKLANLGIPVTLVYLGFTGDTGIPEVEQPFMSRKDWEDAMKVYAADILPGDFVEQAISDHAVVEFDGVPFLFAIRARGIISPTVYPQRRQHREP